MCCTCKVVLCFFDVHVAVAVVVAKTPSCIQMAGWSCTCNRSLSCDQKLSKCQCISSCSLPLAPIPFWLYLYECQIGSTQDLFDFGHPSLANLTTTRFHLMSSFSKPGNWIRICSTSTQRDGIISVTPFTLFLSRHSIPSILWATLLSKLHEILGNKFF